jgi:hypothetical protein
VLHALPAGGGVDDGGVRRHQVANTRVLRKLRSAPIRWEVWRRRYARVEFDHVGLRGAQSCLQTTRSTG